MSMGNCWKIGLLLLLATVGTASLRAEDQLEWKGGKWVQVVPPAEGTPEGELALVQSLFDAGKYQKTIQAAKKFLDRYPDSPHCEDVCLLAGKSEMKRRRYYQGFEWFEKQLDYAPVGVLADQALQNEYEIAELFLRGEKRVAMGIFRLDATDEGLEILRRVAEHVPGTELAVKAILRIGDYYYQSGKWAEATEAYDLFISLFPHSTLTAEVMLRAAKATYASYGGIKFDETPLLEADQRFRALLRRYPAEARQADTIQILRDIIAQRAERVFYTAQFYERTNRPKPAVYYYKLCYEQFPQTMRGRDARAALVRLGEIEPLPVRRKKTPVSGQAEPNNSVSLPQKGDGKE